MAPRATLGASYSAGAHYVLSWGLMVWIPGIALLPVVSLTLVVLLLREARPALPWPFVHPEVLPWFLVSAVLPLALVILAGLSLIGWSRGTRLDAEQDSLEIFRR